MSDESKPGCLKIGCAGLIILFGFCFLVAIVQHGAQPQREKTAEELRADKNVQRAWAGAKMLKQAMRNPDSFKISSALAMDSGAVCYEYRAQNGFGGTNIEQAVLTPNDDFKLQSSNGFSSAWNKHCARKRGTETAALLNMTL